MKPRWTQPTSVLMRLPAAAWGGSPSSLLQAAGLRASPTTSPGVYKVSRRLRLPSDPPDSLVNIEKIAGIGVPSPRVGRIGDLVRDGSRPQPSVTTEEQFNEQLKKMGQPRDPVDTLVSLQLLCSTREDSSYPDTAKSTYDVLRSVVDDKGQDAFPYAAVHIARATDSLRTRYKLISFLLRYQYDDALAGGQSGTILGAHQSGELVFSSSEDLYEGVWLMTPYYGPLLGAMSPAVWGFAVSKTFGSTLFSLGSTLNGLRQGVPAEPLQMLESRSSSDSLQFAELAASSCSASLSWWTIHLDRLMSVVSDPTTFAGPDGYYRPSRHLQCVASIEQVFRRVHSIQTSYRDKDARRVLFHSVLDTLEGLLGHSTETLCDINFATKALEAVRDTMTPAHYPLLLWAAERGVNALNSLQDGFFISRQNSANSVKVPNQQDLTLSDASGHYLKVLRNATHGYGGKPGSSDSPRTEALLANHDGHFPYDLPLIAYLYLLYMLINPDVVGRNSARRAAKN